MLEFQGKVALVTGSSRGIGKAVALDLARKGARVALNYATNDEAARDTLTELRRQSPGSGLFKADVSSLEQVQEMIRQVTEQMGRIDIMVNNAAITRDKLLAMMPEKDWDAVVNVNLKGVYNCAKVVLRPMIQQRWGRIVNMTSLSAILGLGGQANYAASKGGIIGFTKSLCKEVARFNITVNAVCPGIIDTDMTRRMPKAKLENFLKFIPMEKFGQPEDVAEAVSFLTSERARYITGQVLCVDGGLT
ncbi:MAG: 3-oxoacyl-[acyl-carrier-protein] reductase [Deltaproteobacteria bacterium]|nr:3-oxoacyl-[acyl-carrier-protein] reductase [Deltaproteobacteria bacterium]MBW2308858.1 3-oxoacyl-[acyl-carrier-protein] reductase [Deltaproteobacteria bacterium]